MSKLNSQKNGFEAEAKTIVKDKAKWLFLLLISVPLAWFGWNWLLDKLDKAQLELVGAVLVLLLAVACGLFFSILKARYRQKR